jgi:MscS family membrane protein
MTITNHGVRTYRRYATTITVMYKTSREQIQRFVEGIREVAIRHPKSQDDSVTAYFHEMGNSSLNIFFAVIYEVTDHGEWLKARQEVFIEIMALAEELGVEFAFPSTSVYLESMPEQALLEEKKK